MNKYDVIYGNWHQTVNADDAVLAAVQTLQAYLDIHDNVNIYEDFEVSNVELSVSMVIPLYEVIAYLAAKAEENSGVAT